MTEPQIVELIKFMKELCELYTETLNPLLMSFLQKIAQYQSALISAAAIIIANLK